MSTSNSETPVLFVTGGPSGDGVPTAQEEDRGKTIHVIHPVTREGRIEVALELPSALERKLQAAARAHDSTSDTYLERTIAQWIESAAPCSAHWCHAFEFAEVGEALNIGHWVESFEFDAQAIRSVSSVTQASGGRAAQR